jgi:aspartyl-tRNA(Asn)/glutamyl-tRNA(Gln) amidotransferase subunit C
MEDLTNQQIAELALLARLKLSDSETDQLRQDLTAILGHMSALSQLDTADVEPMTHAVPMDIRPAPDETATSLTAEVALAAAPDRAADYFQVPKMIPSTS